MRTSLQPGWLCVVFTFFAMLSATPLMAIERPVIWADAAEKRRLAALVEKYPWAAACLEDMKSFMSERVKNHKTNPSATFEKFPEFPAGIHAHIGALCLAQQSAVLYFMTGEEDYAQYAADVLNVYVQKLGVPGQKPVISGDGGREYWELYPAIGVIYDFAHPFLTKPDTTVFDASSQKRMPFDHAKAQVMFTNVVDNALTSTEPFTPWTAGSNHTIMEGAGLLSSILCIEDKAKRDAYIETFVKGSKPRTGLYWMRQELIDNGGVWPESASYSGLGDYTYMLMESVNRAYPQYQIFDGTEPALRGFLDRLMWVYPNDAERVCFGDSHRKSGRASVSGMVPRIVRNAGWGDRPLAKQVLGQIKADRDERGYAPMVNGDKKKPSYLNVYNSFFGMDALEGVEPRVTENHALVLPFAGIVIQRNIFCTDRKEHGLMYYTGGAEYVHSHLSGLDLELYGAGCVMGAVGASWAPPRKTDVFNNYYRAYAGHNTVVVNGSSRGGTKGFWSSQNMFGMDRTRLEAAEPAAYMTPLSKEFAFSSQRLDDTINNCVQQRVVAMVRTSDTSGYYLDLFRSRSLADTEKQFHDYIYHNIGDALRLHRAGDAELPLAVTRDRYTSTTYTEKLQWGQTTRVQPGWHYFTDVMTSEATAEPIAGAFLVNSIQRYMHVLMAAGVAREYTSAKSPPIYDAAAGYAAIAKDGVKEKISAPVLSIRQHGDAWDQPFVLVFEPSAAEKSSVQSVESIVADGKIIGAKVVSQVGDRRITDRIIAQDADKGVYEDAAIQLSFAGRFAIVRTVETPTGTTTQLYIGDGEKLRFQGTELLAGESRSAVK